MSEEQRRAEQDRRNADRWTAWSHRWTRATGRRPQHPIHWPRPADWMRRRVSAFADNARDNLGGGLGL